MLFEAYGWLVGLVYLGIVGFSFFVIGHAFFTANRPDTRMLRAVERTVRFEDASVSTSNAES